MIQYNEFYPFGLQTSRNWTRDDSKNDFLYNTTSELNRSTGWYETFFRNYDPAIGRFTGIDPLATKCSSFSGYHYAYNNPVRFNDPSDAAGIQPGPPEGLLDQMIAAWLTSQQSAERLMNDVFFFDDKTVVIETAAPNDTYYDQ